MIKYLNSEMSIVNGLHTAYGSEVKIPDLKVGTADC